MTEHNPSHSATDDDLPEQLRIRREKRERMLERGVQPYPVELPRTHTPAEVRESHTDLPADTATGDIVGVTGRVMFIRNTGKLCFATLREGDGTELQAMPSLAQVGEEGPFRLEVHGGPRRSRIRSRRGHHLASW